MENNTQHIDDLLVKQLTGEASPAELREVEQWLSQDAANQHYYEHFRLIWEESVQLASHTEVDENAAWARFQERSSQKTTRSRLVTMNHPLLRAAVITGVVLTIALISYFVFQNNPGSVGQLATVTAIDSVKSDTLPDGSQVVLNKQSQISYPTRFEGNKRPIQLNGEAFFKVTHNTKKPFVVNTNHVTITVVGTSFNVRSRGDTTEVIVETGIVKVAAGQQTITLTAGEKVIIHQNQQVLAKQASTDQLYNYYRSRKFVCDATPVSQLISKINEAYNVNIRIDNPVLDTSRWTVTLNEQELDEILELVKVTFDVSIIKENGQIILR